MIRFFGQPIDPTRVGDLLLEGLNQEKWRSFQASVAFAKRSGVKHISHALSDFSRRGSVEIAVGIDQRITTKEGLQMLLDAVEDRGHIYIFHNRNRSTFHPKLYYFTNETEARSILGSSNLTEGGLYTNYEAGFVIDLDLDQRSDQHVATKLRSALSYWTDATIELCRLLTPGLLNALVEMRAVPTEEQAKREVARREQDAGGATTATLQQLADLFGFQTVPRAPARKAPAKYVSPKEESVEVESALQHDPEVILVKYVPGASGRTSQVHFTQENMETYFHLETSQPVRLRQHQPNQTPGPIENRQLVLSAANRNAKIEVGGARVLVDDYPKKGRPILVFKRVEDDLFDYMLILPGEAGHAELSRHLDSLPKRRSLAWDVLKSSDMKRIWPVYSG